MTMTRTLLAAAAGLALTAGLACTPSDGASPEPTAPETTSLGQPTETNEPTDSVEPTESGEPTYVDPVEIGPPDEDDFPAEVDGWTFEQIIVATVYNRVTDGRDERISVLPRIFKEPARQWSEGLDHDHQELHPGVFCYVGPEGDDSCTANGPSGRLYWIIDRFDTLTLDELAAWTEKFAALVER